MGGGWSGDGGNAFGPFIDDCRSAMRVSKLEVSDGFLPARDATDLGGLERELAWLGRRSDWLKPDELDEVDADCAW